MSYWGHYTLFKHCPAVTHKHTLMHFNDSALCQQPGSVSTDGERRFSLKHRHTHTPGHTIQRLHDEKEASQQSPATETECANTHTITHRTLYHMNYSCNVTADTPQTNIHIIDLTYTHCIQYHCDVWQVYKCVLTGRCGVSFGEAFVFVQKLRNLEQQQFIQHKLSGITSLKISQVMQPGQSREIIQS